MATSDWGEEDDWDLINDDGFVYKRKKRLHLHPTTSASAPPPPDPAAEEKNRRKRKKAALLMLKDKYQKEIDQWELLSNTLKELNVKAQNQHQQLQLTEQTRDSPAQSSDSSRRRLIDDLLAHAETQEAIINNVTNLCKAADALCNAQEDRIKQSFIDLPIWASSPRELMKSLCED